MRLPELSDRALRAAPAPLLAAVGAVAVVVGGHDAFLAAASLTTVVTGALMLVAGAVALSGAIVLWAGPQLVRPVERPRTRIVLAAFAAATLLTTYVLSTALRSADRNALVVPASVLVLLATVAGTLYHGRGLSLRMRDVGATLLGLAGTILAAWQLWYANEYVPSRAGASVELSAEIAVVETDGRRSTGRVTLTTTNRSTSDLIVVGSAYTLLGTAVEPETAPADSDRVARAFRGVLRDPQASRFSRDVRERSPDLLTAGKFVGDRETFRPEARQTRHYAVTFPSGCFDALRLRAEVFAVGDLDLTLTRAPVVRRSARDGYVYILWYVDPGSWLKALVTAPHRWVVIRYEIPDATRLSPPDFVRVTARFPPPSWDSDPPTLAAAERLFGQPVGDTLRLSEVYGNDEVPAGTDARCRSRRPARP